MTTPSFPGRASWRAFRRRWLPDDSAAGRAYIRTRFRLWYFLTRQRAKARQRAQAEYEAVLARYAAFARAFEPMAAPAAQPATVGYSTGPLFSVVTPVFEPPKRLFQETVTSMLAQTYPRWTWHVADASRGRKIWKYLRKCASHDPRIRPIRLAHNMGIAANTNAALRESGGDFVVMLDHDDTLAPFALAAMAQAIREHPEADFLYSDCDKLDEQGHRCEPFFKPDWSPELLLSCNYLDQLSVFRRSLLDDVGWLDPDLDGAQDWDLYLRIAERTQAFVHVPAILYHWRKTARSTAQRLANKPEAQNAQRAAVSRHLARRGLSHARVEFDAAHPIHRFHPAVTWAPVAYRIVSIVIPSRDHAAMLSTCLDGVLGRTACPRMEIEVVVVDTGSIEEETTRLYAKLASEPRVRIVAFPGPFNFSAACNEGVRHSSGDAVLVLNNDVEVLQEDWLARMVQWLDIDHVGVVGAKLLFPDGRVQHGGVIVGLGGLASNLFMNGAEYVDSPLGPEGWYRNLSAVSGACLLTTRRVYDGLGGLDERFGLNYSDVDFCVRANRAGYRVVLTPDARLVHHEWGTHGGQVPRSDFLLATECFRPLLDRGDPFFNPNLSCCACHPELRRDERDRPAVQNAELLRRLPSKELIRLPDDLM